MGSNMFVTSSESQLDEIQSDYGVGREWPEGRRISALNRLIETVGQLLRAGYTFRRQRLRDLGLHSPGKFGEVRECVTAFLELLIIKLLLL